jgi:hypothetical protein
MKIAIIGIHNAGKLALEYLASQEHSILVPIPKEEQKDYTKQDLSILIENAFCDLPTELAVSHADKREPSFKPKSQSRFARRAKDKKKKLKRRKL